MLINRPRDGRCRGAVIVIGRYLLATICRPMLPILTMIADPDDYNALASFPKLTSTGFL